MASQSQQQVPATPPKVSSEDIISQKTDLCISNAIVKTGIGFSAGVVLSVLLFRRRAFPVWLGTGFGMGSGWTDCERSFNPVAVPGVRILNSQSGVQKTEPTLMERLGAKTATLVDQTKSKAQVAVEQGKDKASDAAEAAKDKADKLEDKAYISQLPLLRTVHLDDTNASPSDAKAKSRPAQDCTACRLTGFATLVGLSLYSFREAYLMKSSSSQSDASQWSRSVPRRLHGTLVILFGVASGAAGFYRLFN